MLLAGAEEKLQSADDGAGILSEQERVYMLWGTEFIGKVFALFQPFCTSEVEALVGKGALVGEVCSASAQQATRPRQQIVEERCGLGTFGADPPPPVFTNPKAISPLLWA